MGTSRQRDYVAQFLRHALRDQLPIEVQLELCSLVRDRKFLMTLDVVADLLCVSQRTLERIVQGNPDMRAAGFRTECQGRAVVYPFWVIHHLFHSGGYASALDAETKEDYEDEDQ